MKGYRRQMYRKNLFLAAALAALAALFASFLVGCGGDLAKAREYVRNGDEQVAEIEKEGQQLGNEMTGAFDAIIKDISAGRTPDAGAFESTADSVRKHADSMLKQASAARAEFEKVDSLDDPGEYKAYADLRVKMIDANTGGLEQLLAFLDEASRKLAVEPFDPIDFQTFVTRFGEDIQAVGGETGKLHEQAQNLKKKKELEI